MRHAIKTLLALVAIFALLIPSAHAEQVAHTVAPGATGGMESLKYVILALALAGVLPLAAWIRRYPSIAPNVWMLMGPLAFVQSAVPHLNIAIVSWAEWPGFVKGFEFSALDLIVLALYLGLPHTRRPLPFHYSMLLYFIAVILSSFQAQEPIAALFYPWQLARMYLVYVVVAKSCADERFVPALLTGVAIAFCFEACVMTWQRFALGALQAAGTFGHQNLVGLLSHFVAFPFFALLLSGRRSVLTLATLLACVIIVVLTASRATIGLAGLGYIILFLLSVLHRPTQWKAIIGLSGAIAISVLALAAESSLERRFQVAPQGNYDERVAFEMAATSILADHPMGIGANNYAFFATTEGYSRQAHVATVDLALSPHVHNAYLLTGAETGYFGLVAFMLLLLRPLTTALLCGWQNRKDRRGELLLGLGVGLLVAYIHAYFEWVFLTYEVQYILAMTLGMVAGLAQELGYWKRSNVRGNLPYAFGGLRYRKTFIRPRLLQNEIVKGPRPPSHGMIDKS
jgi:O-antigen ligase